MPSGTPNHTRALQIFAHLGPGDLISLARTSKAFRSVLLARQSTFLWREVLDASVEEGYPPRPEDMTEPAWAGFFYGGSFCSVRVDHYSYAVEPPLTCLAAMCGKDYIGGMLGSATTALQIMCRGEVSLSLAEPYC